MTAKKTKETNTKKYNKCAVNESHNVVHKQLTVVCTTDFNKSQLWQKDRATPSKISTNI